MLCHLIPTLVFRDIQLGSRLACGSRVFVVPGRAAIRSVILIVAASGGPTKVYSQGLGSLDPPHQESASPSPHRVRAALEMLSVLGVGTIWYWTNKDLNARDFDLYWNWPTFRRKILGQETRFDRNAFWTNAYSHPRSGFMLHSVGRANGLGVGESVVLNAAATWLWEVGVEFRERPSLNDLIVNPVAGLALGESIFQLGLFFRRSPDNALNRSAGVAFSPLASLHDRLDGRRPKRDAGDDLGFSREVWHRFQLRLLTTTTFADTGRRDDVGFGVETELVTIPGWGRPGTWGAVARAGSWSTLRLGMGMSAGEVSETDMLARVLLFGYAWQRMSRDGDERPRGVGFLLGLANAFDFETRREPGYRSDLLGNINVLGPIMEVSVHRGGVWVRATLEGYIDFAMVRPRSLDAYLATQPDSTGIKSVVRWYGYEYAWGITGRGRLLVESRGWHLGIEGTWDRFDSIEGHDRMQEEVTDDFHLIDHRLVLRSTLGFQPEGSHLRVNLAVEHRRRDGSIPAKAVATQLKETSLIVGISFVF